MHGKPPEPKDAAENGQNQSEYEHKNHLKFIIANTEKLSRQGGGIMPEASIVVKSTDRYSDAVKKMAAVTKSFSKDVDALETTLYALNKNKVSQLHAQVW